MAGNFIGETLEEVSLRCDLRRPEDVERRLVHLGLTPQEVIDYVDCRQGGCRDEGLREQYKGVVDYLREKYFPERRRL